MTERKTVVLSELAAQVFKRAWEDEDFKRLLIADPRKALAQMKIFYRSDATLHVVEEKPDIGYLVIPLKPSTPAEESDAPLELSDEELEQVAGGTPPNCYFEPTGGKHC